jgi:hypothetical protein
MEKIIHYLSGILFFATVVCFFILWGTCLSENLTTVKTLEWMFMDIVIGFLSLVAFCNTGD